VVTENLVRIGATRSGHRVSSLILVRASSGIHAHSGRYARS
jgi:hypothetical protein